MKLYPLIAFLGYLLRAKTRHAVHPPFAYDCIDKVIRPRQPKGLWNRFRAHYPHHPITFFSEFPSSDLHEVSLSLSSSSPGIWVFPSPYASAVHQKAWKNKLARKETKLSLDIYQYGIIITDPRLICDQHYTIRYLRKEEIPILAEDHP